MTRPAFRFHPPRLALGSATGWVLLRAFGPPRAPWPGPLLPGEAAAAARALAVGARVAARCGRASLTAELGAEAAGELLRDRTQAAVHELTLREAAAEAGEAGAAEGVPTVFLKHVALAAAGVLLPGSRPAGDVDVVVPARAAVGLAVRLRARGYRPSGFPDQPHHLAALSGPGGRQVEVHVHVPGVSLDPSEPVRHRRFATVEALERQGLLHPAPGLPAGARVPAGEVLLAHILAHGLAQHGFAPGSYPLFRMVADALDLGFGDDAGEALADEVIRLTAPWLSAVEVAAAHDLCRRLADGELAGLAEGDQPASALLRHLVAGATDASYRRSLKLRALARGLDDRPPWRALAASVGRSVWLTRAQIDVVYGPQPSRLAYGLRRLLRPWDLLVRLARSLRSSLGVRRR